MGCPRPNVPDLDAHNLRDVAEPLRSILHTAEIRAAAEGRHLGLTSGGRSDGQQWDARRYNGVPHGQECNPAYKGHPTTALPGKSRHRNTGKYENGKLVAAADMNGDLAWLHANADNLGIHFPVPNEAWHAEVTGRKPKWEIIPYGKTSTVKPVWRAFGPGATDASIAALGGGRAIEVSEIQLLLMKLGYLAKQKPDGIYGPVTQRALQAFKAKTIRDQKFMRKAPWPNADPVVGAKTIKMLRNVAAKHK